jgi:cell division protein ZipA
MDIKDWILIGGGLLLVAVIGHGFLLAWRSRRETLRLDIDPNIPRDDVDPLELLRAELPNGGARIRKADPMADAENFKLEPDVGIEPPRPSRLKKPILAQRKTVPQRKSAVAERPIVPERIGADRPTGHIERAPDRAPEKRAERPVERLKPTPAAPQPTRVVDEELDFDDDARPTKADPEVIVINVLARNGAKFAGNDLMEAFLRNGLKFGDMNIFHRVQPASKEVQFSVASAIEPGTFDLSAMEGFRTPGVSFFMQMPGPGQPLEVFEDMLAVTRDVAASLGADLKDEQLSVMTSQTIQHCRSRIEDFSRKRMSQRA